MNTSDSEVVMSVLTANGYDIIDSISAAEKKKKKKKNEVKDEEEEDDDGEEQVPSTATMPEVILVNTCAIRDKAEERVKTRLRQFRSMKTTSPSSSSSVFSKDFNMSNNNNNSNKKAVIGVLGCMGERLKGELLKKDSKGVRLADIVAGPDSYRDLPRLIENAISSSNNDNRQSKKNTNDGGNETLVTSSSSRKRFEPKITETMNVELSTTETYSEIFPMRRGKVEDMSTSAFVTIQRGCDNMCAFCIVPFTRGRERSRDSASILEEAKKRFYEENAREIVLLGQNVNSYSDKTYVVAAAGEEENASSSNTAAKTTTSNGVYAEGFKSVYVPSRNQEYDFAKLLKDVCAISPELRVRFTSPHPKDFPDNLLQTIAETPNASKLLHMPAQSGSTTALERMNRGYSREAYLNLIDKAKAIIPDVAFSSDFISGFCGETEEEHNDTLSLLKRVQYEQAFTFAYSLREKTAASKKLIDDVPEEVKQRRLAEVIETFREAAKDKAKGEIGKTHLVLVEGTSKRDDKKCTGRADNGKRVVFMNEDGGKSSKKGEYVEVRIREAGVNTLIGDFVKKTTAKAFYEANGGKAWYA
jgi:tRNA A37 methylthiotransferase MiaB